MLFSTLHTSIEAFRLFFRERAQPAYFQDFHYQSAGMLLQRQW